MRCLDRNKRRIYYALFAEKIANIDAGGNPTGEHTAHYSDCVPFNANVSAARGMASEEQFGINVVYDRVIVTCDMDCPITETSVLWIDADPAIDGEGRQTALHDYIVKRVAKSLNSISYAVAKVSVS